MHVFQVKRRNRSAVRRYCRWMPDQVRHGEWVLFSRRVHQPAAGKKGLRIKPALRTGLLIGLGLLAPLAGTAMAGEGLRPPPCPIIDIHEHILSRKQAGRYLLAVKKHNLSSIGLLASPREVLFTVDEKKARFTNAGWNNNELLHISKAKPGLYQAFATYSPEDHRIVAKLKRFIEKGGRGLKLYNGHYRFYDIFNIPLDAPHLMPVYQYCEANRVPITFHVNSRYYWVELKHILDSFPKLVVNLPHFCMSLVNLDRIAEIFNNYPNVYSDISCGEGALAYETLHYISRYWALYRELIVTYRTRFLFGADMVITDDPKKDAVYVEKVIANYRHLLESDQYTGILIEGYLEKMDIKKSPENSIFNGLQLDRETLKLIYADNPARFLGINRRP